jgi:hypothetical protein
MLKEDGEFPSTAVPFMEAVRWYATSPFRASLPQPFPGAKNYMGHFPKGFSAAEREATACLRRDLACGQARSWGRPCSPYNPISPIPADSWQNLRVIDWAQEKFGYNRDQPGSFIWNVRLKLLVTLDREIYKYEYLDTAADAVSLHYGIPWEHAETTVISAVYSGQPKPQNDPDPGIRRPAEFTEEGDYQANPIVIKINEKDDNAAIAPSSAVRLMVRKPDRLEPFLHQISRPGDIAVRPSRILPGYDKLQTVENPAVAIRYANADLVLIDTDDLFLFCQNDRAFGSGGSAHRSSSARASCSGRSTAATGSRCHRWLLQLMSTSSPTKNKDSYYREAQQRFGSISRRSFDNAWATALSASGAEDWSKPGPKTALS